MSERGVFAQFIRNRGLKSAVFEQLLNISRHTWITRQRNPTTFTRFELERLSNFLNVDLQQLITLIEKDAEAIRRGELVIPAYRQQRRNLLAS